MICINYVNLYYILYKYYLGDNVSSIYFNNINIFYFNSICV